MAAPWWIDDLAGDRTGDGADVVGASSSSPVPFAPYEANENNELHIVIRAYGPLIRDEIQEQLAALVEAVPML